jgi:hypothetical protein
LVMNVLIILIMMIVLDLHIWTYQIVQLTYVPIVVCHLYLNQTAKNKTTTIKNLLFPNKARE